MSSGWTKLKLSICISEVPQIVITIWSINVTSKFWADSGKMIIKFIREHSWIIINTPFTFRDVTDSFPDFLYVSLLVVCEVFLELTLYSLELLWS